MAVDSTGTTGVDLNSLLGGNMLGLGNDNTSGLVGGLILGSLLRNNGNLFGANGVDGYGVRPATPNDVQNTVGFINTVQDINAARRDIFQAQGNLQNQIAQGLQSEITNNLQGQIALLTAVNNSTQTTGNSLDAITSNLDNRIAGVSSQIDGVTLAVAQGQADINGNIAANSALINQNVSNTAAATNAAIANSTYALAQAISNDGDKTRALIQGIETANLNRMITVAQNEISELRNERAVRGSGIEITQNVNQNQAQAQQQQQQFLTNSLLGQLVGEIQRNTQSVVNLGTMTGQAGQQTAANTRVN